MNHFYRVLTFVLCFMVSNLWGTTSPLMEEAPLTVCADRTASNTVRCMDDRFLNLNYGGYIIFKNLENHYKLENGRFQESLDGTARLTGRWVNIGQSNIKFNVDIRFAGRTSTAPNDPKEHLCLDASPSNFYYYTSTTGTLTGTNAALGAKLAVSRVGPAFQVGVGANVTHKALTFGASGWLAMSIISQPSGSLHLELQTSQAGGNGDININLSGDGSECFGSDITLNCPNDINTVAALGDNGKAVNWNVPVATTTCMQGTGVTCSPTNLSNFEYLGEFNGSRYYCSDTNSYTWLQARDKAIQSGGQLAVVCSAAENEFLRNGLLASEAWIGFSDHVTEGTFKWVTGDNCGYTNWKIGEPNNYGGDEDFTRLLKSSGKWTDRNASYRAEFIMEIPCDGGMEPGEVETTQVEGPAPGSVFPIGTTKVKYEAVDECGNTSMCMFNVIVEEPVDPCAGNGSPIVSVESTDPDCGERNGKIKFTFEDRSNRTNIEFSLNGGQSYPLNVSDNVGMAMFGDLDPGDYSLSVRWGNNDCAVDLGDITLKDIRKPVGSQCDDGDATTINDVILANGCDCGGIPKGEITLTCEDNIAEIAAPGAEGVNVTFDEPNASTSCSLDGLEVVQIEGPVSGSLFLIGSTTVKYRATDDCGNMKMCSFDVVVEETPLKFEIICADDIEVTAAVGEDGRIVTFSEPSVDSNCPTNGTSINQIAGPASGSVFPVGTTTVTFEVEDDCDQTEVCSIIVKVNPAPTGDITFTCNDDITIATEPGADNAIVNYTAPTASTTCSLNGLNVDRTSGLASGSSFPVGMTTITYTATDACGSVETCTFKVTVTATAIPKGSIGNFVFLDEDRDGIQDPNEIGIGGVTVKLQDAAGTTLRETQTQNDGSYLFADVEAGSYKIMVNTPNDLVLSPADQGGDDNKDSDIQADGMTEVFTLVAGQDKNDIDAGLNTPIKVKVGDIVFLDANSNGLQDDNESGISGIIVNLYDENDDLVAFRTTDNNGMYMFGDLDPGSYKLKFSGASDELEVTTQDAGTNDDLDSDIDENGFTGLFALTEGFDDSRDAGFKPKVVEPLPARIGNQVFLDANENGVKDADEAGINGVQVKLLAVNGDVIETATTQNNGMYGFSVTAGTYKVMFGTPFGFNPTNQSGDATDGIDNDSDNDPTTGMTEIFIVVAGETNSTIDAGFVTIPEPCNNVTDGGTIAEDEDPRDCGPFDASIITNATSPTGGSGDIEYIWLASTEGCPTELSSMILGANDPTYDPSILTTTTYFVRYARRVGCEDWVKSNCVIKKVDDCDNNNPVDCDAITVTETDGKVTVDGLEGSNSKVEIIGAGTNWIPQLVCGDGGNACQNSEMIANLPEGEYTLKIQLWGADGSYCYTERKVTITDGDPTCQVSAGTISTNDDITDLCVSDNEPSLVNFAVSGGSASNTAWVVTGSDGQILNADAPSTIDFEGSGAGACNIYFVWYENIEGLAAGQNISDLDGCFVLSNRITVTRKDDCDTGGEPQCEDVEVTIGNGKINLVGLSAPFVVVKIHDINAGWIIIDQCINCEDPTTFNVPDGDYNVVIEFYKGFWDTKYCRRDVEVTVGGGNPCTDADNDGVCVEDDCDDTDPSIGAKQAAGTSCDDGDATTVNDEIQADGCTCEGEDKVIVDREVCVERDVFNTDNCQFNIIYGLYLKLEGYDEYYEVSDGSFIEYTDGTALYTATAINNTSPEIGWEIEVEFGDRTTLAAVAPKQHNCLTADVDKFYFYETLVGKLTGIKDAAGASMKIDRIGPAFQLGIAANITHKEYDFGGGGWFVADMLTQPTNGLELILNKGAQGQHGDININLSGDGTECVDGRDNTELDCANVTATATENGISITGLTAPIEIVKVFDANWVPVADCAGDCGESMEVPTVSGNYLVRVNFYTANWVGECEVDIPVNVPSNRNGASNRNAAQLNLNTFEDNRAVTVEWLTNTGYKNQSYVIEKSTDGTSFKAINEVDNKEQSDDLAYYKGKDIAPELGTNYYRVKQIYNDGSFDYSEVQLVNFKLDLQSLAVFPNPAKEELFVSLKDHAGQKANLQIINNYGQVLRQLEIDEIPAQAIRLDLGDIQNGLYHLSIRVENSNIITKKILVSRLY